MASRKAGTTITYPRISAPVSRRPGPPGRLTPAAAVVPVVAAVVAVVVAAVVAVQPAATVRSPAAARLGDLALKALDFRPEERERRECDGHDDEGDDQPLEGEGARFGLPVERGARA